MPTCDPMDFVCILKDTLTTWLANHWWVIALSAIAVLMIVFGGLRMKIAGVAVAAVVILWFVGVPQLGLPAHKFLIGLVVTAPRPRKRIAEVTEAQDGAVFVETSEEVVQVSEPAEPKMITVKSYERRFPVRPHRRKQEGT